MRSQTGVLEGGIRGFLAERAGESGYFTPAAAAVIEATVYSRLRREMKVAGMAAGQTASHS